MNWLSEFLAWSIRWVPRIGLCRTTHRGLKFLPGGRTSVINPGLFLWWPLTTEIELRPVVQYSVDLAPQTLTTSDDVPVVVSVVLVIEIADITSALSRAFEVDDVVVEVGGAVAVRSVVGRTWGELRDSLETDNLSTELTARASRLLTPFGVLVLQARLTECSRVRALRLIGNGTGIG